MFSNEVDAPAGTVHLGGTVGQVVLEGPEGGALVGVLQRVGVVVDVAGPVDTTGGGEGSVRHAVEEELWAVRESDTSIHPATSPFVCLFFKTLYVYSHGQESHDVMISSP